MAITAITYNHTWTFSHPHNALPLFLSHSNFTRITFSHRKYGAASAPSSPLSHFRVFCRSETESLEIRRCAPILESSLLGDKGGVGSDEWKVVPDIWRSSAEKYGDNVALVDPYHHPPTTMTYKQLEQAILDFAEGLRVIGVRTEEKLALFADNSCRWLVADQVVDNPEMFNRVANTFYSRTTMRFVILLWGEKSEVLSSTLLITPTCLPPTTRHGYYIASRGTYPQAAQLQFHYP
ncbi:unnamed protein product [Sphenostylis stenocarpa]|uniref:AMP-dependent synthetase/ligase domain-containing protein n=1 Tax=Sphenostylis stenocarpa TaxID=92480 RepID=A0AA86S925_9FABA|nr:unnamed protein product [Sphenostylis stenocarpa]